MGYDDNRNQPTSMKVDRITNSADKVVNYAYQYYDANGKNNNRIRQITDNIDTAYSTSYLYDDYNRLTNATANAFSRSYTYDPFGNINNFAGLTLNYATNSTGAPATNRLLSDSQSNSYTYDAAGNMTAGAGQAYSYDGANRLKEVGTGGANVYGYDGDGKRVKKTESGSTVYYVYSSKLGQSVMEVTSSSVQRAYVYSGSKMVAMQSTDGQFYWSHLNHVGNTRAMTDVNGNLTYKGQFDPYGATLTEWSSSGNANLNSKKFTEYERDSATGLDYANARMYNSGRGRFMKPDPIGLKASNFKKPESLNRYSYTNNDPVNFIDPSGNDSISAIVSMMMGYLIIRDSVTITANLSGSGIGALGGDGQFLPEDGPVDSGTGGGEDPFIAALLALKAIIEASTATAFEKLAAFANVSPNCVTRINEISTNNGVAGLGDAANKSVFFDITKLPSATLNSTLLQLGLVGNNNQDANRTLKDYFSSGGSDGVVPAAATFRLANGTPVIYFGNKISASTGIPPQAQGLSLVDELLHVIYNTNHAGVASKLGLVPSGTAISDSDAAGRIDSWLASNCKP